MNASMSEDKINKIVGLSLVLALHGALLYMAMSYKLIPPPQEAVTLFVDMINPPPKKEEPPPPEPPKPPPKKVELVKDKPIIKPQPAPVLVAEAPVTSPAEPVAPPPPPQPVIEAPQPEPVVVEPEKLAQPVIMSSELSLACPDRNPPNYPAISRRLGEQGQVKLKVELDETGRVTSARVVESSGFKRLDEAGLNAVKSWRCNPATRDGKPVRAVALQPLDFILN